MITGKLRKRGGSFVVTVPRQEVERLQLQAGQTVSIEVRPIPTRPALPPDLQQRFDDVFPRIERGLRYLGDH